MAIRVRTAGRADLDFICWVMFTAGTSHLPRCIWELLFDMSADEVMAFLRAVAVTDATHWCHVDRFLIAEVGGVAAGALCTFDPTTEGTAALSAAMLPIATATARDAGWLDGTLARAVVIEAATPKDYADSWGIENVAVRPEFRGTGIVEALFDGALQLARGSGRAYAQIMCLNGNERAQRAWERQGFELRADYRSAAFEHTFGCPGLKLLVHRFA